MIDFLALLFIWLVVLLVVLLSAGDIVGWAREEWRRLRAETWAPDNAPCTVQDPRVALMTLKQRALGKRMRRDGRSLLASKPYVPVLTKPAASEATPPKSDKVVPIRRATR